MIEQTLREMHQIEQIPAPVRRAQTRARLVEAYGDTQIGMIQTQIGWIGVAWTGRGIVALELPRASRGETLTSLKRTFPAATFAEDIPAVIGGELSEYAAGDRTAFTIPLDWSRISPFQRAVLSAARKIPFGETRTYGWIAGVIGKPRAARAVGRALATNPIPIILPCHRVIGSDGSLTGYGGGLPLKSRLLELEARIARA